MKRIWLVRHGESKAQTGETEDGRDPELSKRGRKQARRLEEPLGAIPFETILVSPLTRARQTYELAGARAGHAEFDSRLAEANWGMPDYYAGILPVITPAELAAPDRHNAWRESAETRAENLVLELMARGEQDILLFGHWGIFTRVFLAFCGMPVDDWGFQAVMDNTAISLLESDAEGRRYIRYWNDRSHVADLL